MTPWKQALERQLSEEDAPPVLSLSALTRVAQSVRGAVVPTSTLQLWIRDAIARHRLGPVIRGLYLNLFTSPPGRLADAVPHLRRDAVVSLHSALDEAGAYNNPPVGVTAILPLDTGPTRPVVGRVTTGQGPVYFRAMPRKMLEAGDVDDRLDFNKSGSHPHATPEKALLDWLYLAASPRSTLAPPAPHDLDMTMLSKSRLNRLAGHMGLRDVLEDWLAGKFLVRKTTAARHILSVTEQ